MRDVSASVCLWAISWLLAVPGAVYAGVFEGLSINTPLSHEIMRQAKSAGMRSYINGSVKPCNEFYGYACGNFARINPAQDAYSTGVLNTLYTGYKRRVRQLLREPKMSTDSPTETKVKYFYESCLSAETQGWNQRPYLLAMLKEFGGLPALEGSAWNESRFDTIEVMARLLNRYGKVTLLDVHVSPGLANSQTNRLYLGQPDLLDTYNLEGLLVQLLGLNYTLAHKTASEIDRLNVQLSRGMIERQDILPPGQMNRLRMLNEMTDSYGPSLNLTHFVQIWLNHDYQLPVYEYVESYLWQLMKVLPKTSKRVLANYMLSSLLSDFQKESCEQKTTQLFTDFVDHMVYRSLEKQNPHIPGSLRQLWQELKVSFENILRAPTANWLGEKTLKEALAKLKAMSFQIRGAETQDFEDYYGTLVISSADYFGNVQRLLEFRARQLREKLQRPPNLNSYNDEEASPFYASQFNCVIIPASFMQHRYLFDDVYPMALKYGTFGYLLAHKMAHGFDDISRTFDAQGNLRDWWERSASEQFEQRKQCLVTQFSGFTYKDVKLPKTQMQYENIADNVGVRIAHAAYLSWLQQSALDSVEESEVLPRLTHTPQQLFFLALGQIWCTDLPFEPSLPTFSDDAPNEVRLNAIASNSDAFAQAYECSSDTKMNPSQKCVIY